MTKKSHGGCVFLVADVLPLLNYHAERNTRATPTQLHYTNTSQTSEDSIL